MPYRAPIDDLLFAMRRAAGEAAFAPGGLYADLDAATAAATLEEAAKFAENALAPLDHVGDRDGVNFSVGTVTTAPGWREAYSLWVEGGWNALSAPPGHGGMGLPLLLAAACTEIWNAANISFALCPLLGQGAIEAMEIHASEALKSAYLPKMISGEWPATMNLTEPQAGSDLAHLRTRAERAGDGSYRLFGQKIFITYGEHDLSENIIHLVLARLPDAPAGTRGISLFLAPKFLPGPDGRPGARNDVRCVGIERKLGIHGSPTCTMSYGDTGGAIAFLVGRENEGLACMFAMMNNARLSVGLQGVGLAERATQTALAYARERRQGRGPSGDPAPIVEHPDVVRMLLTMKAQTAAARGICYLTAASLDRARRLEGAQAQAAQERAGLLTPLAKAYSTDIGCEVASLGIQIHGGMGFIEETGAAQLLRDARITPIYEGTNGIQAIDLVTRKLRLSKGAAVWREIDDMRDDIDAMAASNDALFVAMSRRAAAAVDAFERATDFLSATPDPRGPETLAGATPYLRLFALARGVTLLGAGALAARRAGDTAAQNRIVTARFFADNLAVAAEGLERAIIDGGDSVGAGLALLSSGGD
ncbi:acyl-CoA dehydrogenase [Methylosinus sporium]|uniref:3-methylmercaptopropionyl-CoA dehydrogenase n=1 Tax=Methylosinus sporium TaxID=428 RepID=A0A2U1SVV6_METSR|nr:acyl-CoA dehydrogenase [Methylosinus sporium]PWB95736.1 acyl-CoA dehydrogenase [Methylosinus sporium]